jgi:tRNA-Thr(GGU) m(6)t(6)A37 methyltransferase TsaA
VKRASTAEKVELKPIGLVETRATRDEVRNRSTTSRLILREDFTEALQGIDDFSHLFVVFWMHEVSSRERKTVKVHPRGRADMPLTGVFATRTQLRPNPIGLTLVELLDVKDHVLTVRGLDAFDGTPILDIKPFDPSDTAREVRVPEWWTRLERERSKKHQGSKYTPIVRGTA